MLSVNEAEKLIFSHLLPQHVEEVPLKNAVGRYLAQDILADRPFPPFDRVAMDGIAIKGKESSVGELLQVSGIQAAGEPQKSLLADAIEVMTGAVLPLGVDTVIPYEHLEWEKDGAMVRIIKSFKQGQNVHHNGSDHQQGEVLLKKHAKITSAEVAVLATVGKAQVSVVALPKVAVISTGDELVPVSDLPEVHQIRRSNGPMLAARLEFWGIQADEYHLKDDREILEKALKGLVLNYQVLLFTGGVSMGKFDYLPGVFEACGITKQFHKVAQRPGKPFWFGTFPKGLVFALPGNPVSSFLCYIRYVHPWFAQYFGSELPVQYAVLDQDINFKPNLTRFCEVKLSFGQDGRLLASPTGGGGSGDLAKLCRADAFMELPSNLEIFKKGTIFRIFPYK
ncbi:molybdopterin molybdotransferase MoeA [Persicobacter diffluens]|uniref:Molybdopterin molybdenumtransferase n=1 Tax=Persicobacter diffluens TaxID=981 RepID=A0AAN5AKB5_9BACT|nr:molybdopterin molybdenumtransferase MoeA [Persicobacter diffluens]